MSSVSAIHPQPYQGPSQNKETLNSNEKLLMHSFSGLRQSFFTRGVGGVFVLFQPIIGQNVFDLFVKSQVD